jgi:hypothetical protein
MTFRRRSIQLNAKNTISTKDIRTAIMLFVVSFLFIVFYLPSILATNNVVPIDKVFIIYLYFTNSAINPMIYCFMNPTFRSDLVKLFYKRDSFLYKCINRRQ